MTTVEVATYCKIQLPYTVKVSEILKKDSINTHILNNFYLELLSGFLFEANLNVRISVILYFYVSFI